LEVSLTVTINGKQETIDDSDILVTDLLRLKNVKMPEMVSVQLNGDILPRESFGSTAVRDRDEVEFLYFMGGGSRERGGAR
jgi:sulfur carrier protein